MHPEVKRLMDHIASRYGEELAADVLDNEQTYSDWEALLLENIDDSGIEDAAEAAVDRYERDAAIDAAEAAAAERQRIREAVDDALTELGFMLTGASERSEALYYDHPHYEARRVRVAEHEPVYDQSAKCWQIAIGELYPSAHVVVDDLDEVHEVITQWFDRYLAHATPLEE